MLDLAAKHAVRAWGRVEPNPLVGCVLARRASGREGSGKASGEAGSAFDAARRAGWEIIGIGHHRRFGGAHAEVEALRNARERGFDPRGATAWVTLEPCDHTGKTGPCARALLEAGVAEVIFARRDPNPISTGGAATLARGGVPARVCGESDAAMRLAQPFIASLTRDKPWIIAKWAQTPDGRLVTGPGEARWISGEKSRRRVHELRARVDAIVTGIGTVLADDPALTVRRGGGRNGSPAGPGSSAGVRVSVRGSVRGRPPLRVVMDSGARTPLSSAVVETAREVPTLVLCAGGAAATDGAREAIGARVRALRERGVEVEACAASNGRVNLSEALASLARRGVGSALLEAGPTLLGEACAEGLVDEAWAFIAGAAGDATLARQASAIVAPMLGAPTSVAPVPAGGAAWADAVNARSGEDRLVIWRRAER